MFDLGQRSCSVKLKSNTFLLTWCQRDLCFTIFGFAHIENVLCSLHICSGGSLVAYSDSNKKEEEQKQKKKKVVVLGTGWAGISFLKDLDISSYDVQVVSPQNYFAFTPLLPSVTCGTVEARSIVESVRNITKKVSLYLWSIIIIC